MMINEDAVFEKIKSRLTILVDNRPYRFLDTKKMVADHYLTSLTSFAGLTEEEILNLESSLSVRFPTIFRCYLKTLGRSRGTLFDGSDLNPEDYIEFKHWAEELLSESGLTSFLTSKTVVFLFHQGYSFMYFESDSTFDTPVYQYVEGHNTPEKMADGFLQFLENQLQTMERANQDLRENGGYYLTVCSDGVMKRLMPAKNSQVRPIDEADQYLDGKTSKWRRKFRK